MFYPRQGPIWSIMLFTQGKPAVQQLFLVLFVFLKLINGLIGHSVRAVHAIRCDDRMDMVHERPVQQQFPPVCALPSSLRTLKGLWGGRRRPLGGPRAATSLQEWCGLERRCDPKTIAGAAATC